MQKICGKMKYYIGGVEMNTFFAKQLKKILICMLIMIISCSIFVINAGAENSIRVVEKQLFGSPDVSTSSLARSVDFDMLKEYMRKEIIKSPEYVDIASFSIPDTTENLHIISDFIWYECPELFHVESLSYSLSGGIYTKIYIDYSYSAQEYAEMYNECMNQVNKLIDGIKGNDNLTDVQKALILHDRLAAHCEYDIENYYDNSIPDENFTMYGALVNRFSVCQGYAETYYYMLENVGIKNRLCSSNALYHVWNIVTVNGKEYHVDVTWDDPIYDKTGQVMHTNFLRSSNGIFETGHDENDYDTSPTDTTYDSYFWQDSETEFQMIDNEIYYLDNEDAAIKKYSNKTTVADCTDIWPATTNGSYWVGNFSRLSSDGTNLYYSTSEDVCKYTISSGKTEKIWSPDLSAGELFRIYGFTYKDGYLICDINDAPNFDINTKKTYQQRYLYHNQESATLQSISISTPPAKTEYYIGDEINTAGLQLKLTYSNGMTELISDGFAVGGFSSSSVGTKKVTVSYKGFSETFNVTVRTPNIVLDADSVKIEVNDYCILVATTDPENVTVKWSTSDNNIATISDGEIAAKSVGSATVTAEFTYNGYTYKTTCNVTVECKHYSTITINGKDATCNESGLTDGKKCSVCGVVTVEQQIIPATGDHVYAIETKRVASTCKTAGYVEMACGCGETKITNLALDANNHENIVVLDAVSATCTKSGLTEGKKCSACGTVTVAQQTINAKGHTQATREENRKEASCSTAGSYNLVTYCTVCNEVIKTETKTIPATGDHVYAIETKRVASTCKTAGYVITACGCGKTKTTNLALDSNNHENIVILDAVSATCTKSGLTEGKKCSACGTVTVAQQTINAKGHTQATREENRKEASCSTAGSYNLVTYCTVCNEVIKTETKTIPATGNHVYATETKRVASTCKTAGYVEMACGCGKTKTTNLALDANNHENIVVLDAVSATCTKSGLTEGKKCSACGTVTVAQQIVSAKGHIEIVVKGKDSTCTETGLTDGKKCSVCGVVTVAQNKVEKKSHSIVKIPGTAPTETETGLTDGEKCSVCGTVTEEQQIIPVLNHTHVYTAIVVAPTCIEKGYTTYSCKCGDAYVDEYSDATGHKTEIIAGYDATCTETGLTDGEKCAVCGEILKSQYVIAAKSHDYGEWFVEKPATTESEGLNVRICTHCGDRETEIIPQLPEIPNDPVKPEKMLADANGDNKITAADARLILRMAAKLETSSDAEIAYLDINGDKKITAADARIALRISAKIDSIENYKKQ